MFHIGDKIFYPMHGGGIIETVEEREILGKTQQYYVVNILHRNMQVMIPTNKTESLGMRHIVDAEQMDNVLTTLYEGETDTTVHERQRPRLNLTKMKSGDLHKGVEVIRDLTRINSKKKLGTAEKNMLENARQILLSEVMLVKDIPSDQAAELLDQVIKLQ